MPDTAASAAAPNAVIHLRREYLIIGDPMWLDAWGGRTPDTAASKIFTENGETKVGTTRGRYFTPTDKSAGDPERLNRVRRHSPPAERHTGVPYEIAF